jgi:16S rRNA (cytosine1402-N4)-methyltransferase
MSELGHQPVLLDAVVDALITEAGGFYIDGTFGRGGHSQAMLSRLNSSARLLVFDKDPRAIAAANSLAGRDSRVMVEYGSFAGIRDAVERAGQLGKVSGVLLDLGVSSPQLDDPERGFSFSADGPLDMRMDTQHGPSAAEWLAKVTEEELARVLFEYGEERYSRRIARAVVKARSEEVIERTGMLAEIIARAHPAWERHKHPATRSFQAIRIAVNRELDDLQQCLADVAEVLSVGGRLAVISFHSLEDRMIKRFVRGNDEVDPALARLPIINPKVSQGFRWVVKQARPSAAEIEINPRSRSAVLRVAERAR